MRETIRKYLFLRYYGAGIIILEKNLFVVGRKKEKEKGVYNNIVITLHDLQKLQPFIPQIQILFEFTRDFIEKYPELDWGFTRLSDPRTLAIKSEPSFGIYVEEGKYKLAGTVVLRDEAPVFDVFLREGYLIYAISTKIEKIEKIYKKMLQLFEQLLFADKDKKNKNVDSIWPFLSKRTYVWDLNKTSVETLYERRAKGNGVQQSLI